MNTLYRKLLFVVLVGSAVGSWAARDASAASLGLTLENAPDTLVLGASVDYDATNDQLDIGGLAFQLDVDGGSQIEFITGGNFDLSAGIDDSGALAVGPASSFTISGTIPSLGFNSGTLLTGNLTDFGFGESSANPLFEFEFEVTGGDVAGLYPNGVGSTGGMIFGNDLGFSPHFSFANDFSNSGNGTGDVAPTVSTMVPVPAAFPLGVILMAGAGSYNWLRRRTA